MAKKLAKAQDGKVVENKAYNPAKKTPMQEYLKRKNTTPSDTLIKRGSSGSLAFKGYRAEDPKNQKALQKAGKKTSKLYDNYKKTGGSIKTKKK